MDEYGGCEHVYWKELQIKDIPSCCLFCYLFQIPVHNVVNCAIMCCKILLSYPIHTITKFNSFNKYAWTIEHYVFGMAWMEFEPTTFQLYGGCPNHSWFNIRATCEQHVNNMNNMWITKTMKVLLLYEDKTKPTLCSIFYNKNMHVLPWFWFHILHILCTWLLLWSMQSTGSNIMLNVML